MNENQPLDGEEVPGLLGAVWHVEKFRFYFNLILIVVVILPFTPELFSQEGGFAIFRFALRGYFIQIGFELLITFAIYNLMFSIIYLVERQEIRKKRKLLETRQRGQYFRFFLFLALIHLLLRLSGKLDSLYPVVKEHQF